MGSKYTLCTCMDSCLHYNYSTSAKEGALQLSAITTLDDVLNSLYVTQDNAELPHYKLPVACPICLEGTETPATKIRYTLSRMNSNNDFANLSLNNFRSGFPGCKGKEVCSALPSFSCLGFRV